MELEYWQENDNYRCSTGSATYDTSIESSISTGIVTLEEKKLLQLVRMH